MENQDSEDSWPFVIRNGSRDEPKVAITVDDCFEPDTVRKIFDLCVSHGVSVTFFPLGNQLRAKQADMWKEIAASPYVEIGSHTQNHTSWSRMHNSGIDMHLRRMQECLDDVLGYRYQVQVVRPPYGHYTDKTGSYKSIKKILDKYGFKHVILWDVSQTDPNKAIKQVKNGSIMLYHARKKDLKCLEKLIPMLLEAGYQPVTVSELLGFGPVQISEEIPAIK